MNEAENQNRPVEEEAFVIDPNDFKDEDDITSLEDTKQPTEEEVSTPTETKTEGEVDFTPLLTRLSKDIKYMDQEVNIASIEDVITNYQKGLDYDRKTEKIKELENSEELVYIREKAKEQGMTPSEYIKAIKDFEVQEEKRQDAEKLNEMIENGVAENIAREVIETAKARREFQRKEAELNAKQTEIDAKAKKDAENDAFISAYPNVDVKTIPKEVFTEAEKTGLLTAYTKYQNEQLRKELETLKQNQSNKETSPIKGTTEHGGVVIENDPFLKGLGF